MSPRAPEHGSTALPDAYRLPIANAAAVAASAPAAIRRRRQIVAGSRASARSSSGIDANRAAGPRAVPRATIAAIHPGTSASLPSALRPTSASRSDTQNAY